MNKAVKETISLLDILPENDQNLILELARKLVLAWDPDFTKVTPQERIELEQARKEIERGEYTPHNEINWD